MKKIKPIKKNDNFYIKDNKLFLTEGKKKLFTSDGYMPTELPIECTFYENGVLALKHCETVLVKRTSRCTTGKVTKNEFYSFFNNEGEKIWSFNKYPLYSYGPDETLPVAYENNDSFMISDIGIISKKDNIEVKFDHEHQFTLHGIDNYTKATAKSINFFKPLTPECFKITQKEEELGNN
jgi:hypothetical protein